MLLIPAIDLLGGRCVRLYRGDFAAVKRYESDADTLVARYGRLGATWVHVVDLDGAKDGGGSGCCAAGAIGSVMCDACFPPRWIVFRAGSPVGQAFWNSALAMATRSRWPAAIA